MLGEEKLKTLHELLDGYSHEELIWINGYLSGIVARKNPFAKEIAVATETKPVAAKKIHLLFGTETGNSKRLATQLAAAGKKKGINVKLTDLSQYRIEDLPKEEYFFVVISTQGE